MRKGLVLVLFLIFVSAVTVLASSRPPAVGKVVPEVAFPSPPDQQASDYLDIQGPFKIAQLKAPVIIIEILSMYCPYCQSDASNVNSLFKLVEGDGQLKDKIKIIGIAAGNSPFEMNLFKKKFNIAFPIFPDPEFKLYEQIGGEVRTPYFIGVNKNSGKAPMVFYSAVGSFGDPAKFLQTIVKAAGLQ